MAAFQPLPQSHQQQSHQPQTLQNILPIHNQPNVTQSTNITSGGLSKFVYYHIEYDEL